MVKVYVNLILAGIKTIEQVPFKLRLEVAKALEQYQKSAK